MYLKGWFSYTVQVVASAPGSITVCCITTAQPSTASLSTDWPTPIGGFQAPNGPVVGGNNGACEVFAPTAGPLSKARFLLYNKLESLTAPGDWFYDTDSKQVYFYSPTGAAPTGNAVTVKQRPVAFDLASANGGAGISFTNINGLNVFASTIATGKGSWSNTLDSLNVKYPSYFMDLTADPNMQGQGITTCDSSNTGTSTTGVILAGHDNTIKNSTVIGSSGNGIVLWNTDPMCTNGAPCADGYAPMANPGNTATHNVISDVGFGGVLVNGAVVVIGDRNTVTHNTMRRCGRACLADSQANSTVGLGLSLADTKISYNDVSGYCMLSVDCGGLYFVSRSIAGSTIDHNWFHDPQAMETLGPPTNNFGIYLDGGVNGAPDHPGLIYNNVGWNNNGGLLGIVYGGNAANAAHSLHFYNNDGGGTILIPNGCLDSATKTGCSKFVNNIGTIEGAACTGCGTLDPNVEVSGNLASSTDPQYTDIRVNDYRLQSTSPARSVGQCIPGVTDGGTDTPCDLGAYQYGAPRWVPGATPPSSKVVMRYGANGVVDGPTCPQSQAQGNEKGPGDWYYTCNMLGLHESGAYGAHYGWLSPDVSTQEHILNGNRGTVRFTYPTPSANPTDPNFANLSNLAIDNVHFDLYGYMQRNTAAAELVVSDAAGTIWDSDSLAGPSTGLTSPGGVPVINATGTNFMGFPLRTDITARVGGSWSNLPSWIDVYGQMAQDAGWPSGIWIYGVELNIESHCIDPTRAPCSGSGAAVSSPAKKSKSKAALTNIGSLS